ncbi:MAG: aldo/keto reductase, partial [Bryobacteraceae bacterium]
KEVVEHVDALTRDLNVNRDALAEIALRFCISHKAVSTVIPGMRRVRNAEANMAVPDKGPLDVETLGILKQHVWKRNFYDFE